MSVKLEALNTIIGEVCDLRGTIALLDWDQQTYMPRGGAESRGQQIATLSRLAHERLISAEVGSLLDDLQSEAAELDPDSDAARIIKVTRREYERNVKVPSDLVAEMAQAATTGHEAWAKARAEKRFEVFRPALEHLVELRQRYALLFAPYEHIYDPLLDEFEPGMTTADVRGIFEALRPQQVALIQSIRSRPQVDASFLYRAYDEQKQWDFGVDVATHFCYDWQRGRQDRSVHPFTTSFAYDDVRITTRINPNYLGTALFGTMHETGHALYDQGLAPQYDRTLISGGASLAIHESQSRLWENLVGRSLPFWEYFYPRLQASFPGELGAISLETFYRGINRVQPSLIRVEADEATYNLHIMLRLELEIALVEGSLAVKDLPQAWNSRMQEYLGLTPPDDVLGVLQDIHWSQGSIGYFSTYALGNLISVQLWERIQADLPGLEDDFRRGEFGALREWLGQNIHRHGSKYEPQELVQRVTGSKIDPAPYVRYLQQKFGRLYGL